MSQGVSLEDAANYLGVSTKTIRRYLQSGKLSGQKRAGRWTVNLDEESAPDEAQHEAQQATINLADLKAELEAIRSERDWLRRLVEDLTSALVADLDQKRMREALILDSIALQSLRPDEYSGTDLTNTPVSHDQASGDLQRVQSRTRRDTPTSSDRAAS